MAIRRVGEHHTGHKGTQSRRKMQRLHKSGRTKYREKSNHDKEFALPHSPCDAQNRGNHEPTSGHQSTNRQHGVKCQNIARRRCGISRCTREGCDDGNERNDSQILKQQDRKGTFSKRRVDASR
jgi:hypothetical protein